MPVAFGRKVERDVDDHVFLSADQTPFAGLHQDGLDVNVVPLRGGLGVPQEAGKSSSQPAQPLRTDRAITIRCTWLVPS